MISNTRVAIVVAVLLLLVCSPAAFAGLAFDRFTGTIDNGSGPAWTLTDTAETGSYTASIRSRNPEGAAITALVGQPTLQLSRGSANWTGFAMCIDTATFIRVGDPEAGYNVYDWSNAQAAGKVGTMAPLAGSGHSLNYIWNRLTFMWANSGVTSDADRAALQMATWLGCADQWDGLPGDNFIYSGLDATVQAKAVAYLAAAQENNSSFANSYAVVADDAQDFVVAVPEPSSMITLAGACSLMGAALGRRRTRRK